MKSVYPVLAGLLLSVVSVSLIDCICKRSIESGFKDYFYKDTLVSVVRYDGLRGLDAWKCPPRGSFPGWGGAYGDVLSFCEVDRPEVCTSQEFYVSSGYRVAERVVYPVVYGVLQEGIDDDYVYEYLGWLSESFRSEESGVWNRSFQRSVEGARVRLDNRYYCLGDAIKEGKVSDSEVEEEYMRMGFNEYYGDSNIRVFFRDKMIDAAYIRPNRVWLRFVDGAVIFVLFFFLTILLRRRK